jgi:hypothetical protein
MLDAKRTIVVFLVTVAVSATSPAFALSQCTGRWRVAIQTTSGTCEPNEHSRAIDLTEDGQIELANPSNQFDLSGSVSSCNTVSLVITRGAEIAEGSGRITGDEAQGTWTVKKPASKKCSGTWFARKH